MTKKSLLFLFGLIAIFFVVLPAYSGVRAQSCSNIPTSNNSITSLITISNTGTYKIWSRIIAPDSTNNSFYLQIDGGCAMNIGDSPNIPVNAMTWVSYQDGNQSNAVQSLLTEGNHVIKVTEREGGVGLDKILFTTDTQCLPVGTGDNCPSVTDTPTSIPPSPTTMPTIFVTTTPEPTAQPTPIPTDTPIPSNTPTPTPTATPTPTRIPTATPGLGAGGLLATYYDNSNFTGTSVSRIDPSVNFNWGTGSPDPAIKADTFSATWTGYVIPKYSQKYTFYAKTDDGVRLYVNGTRIINNWRNQSANEVSGTITLTAGRKYSIRMEYYENAGLAVAQLSWKSNSQTKQIIPQSQLSIN